MQRVKHTDTVCIELNGGRLLAGRGQAMSDEGMRMGGREQGREGEGGGTV